ncbi:MAG TPA: alpha/beta hydrolase [Planctomycetaceae bacterium]|nr:alpha/beta hydrolase [Planctomycetaceae bacterium]
MALDPQAAEYLERLRTASPTAPYLLSVEAARESVVPVPPPESVHVDITDSRITAEGREIAIRIYRPQGSTAAADRPLVVFFHGGGWVLGDLNSHDGLCRVLTRDADAVLVSVEYRLAPEFPYPAALEDALLAIRWVVQHAAELGANPNRLVVAGDSAGANIAAAAALRSRDEGGPPIAFQLLMYPVTDRSFETASYLDNATGYQLTRSAMMWFWRQYLQDEDPDCERYTSVLRNPDLSGLPPAYVLTAEYDPLRDEGDAYAESLQAAGVTVAHRRCPGLIHGFLRRIDVFERAWEEIALMGQAVRAAQSVRANP